MRAARMSVCIHGEYGYSAGCASCADHEYTLSISAVSKAARVPQDCERRGASWRTTVGMHEVVSRRINEAAREQRTEAVGDRIARDFHFIGNRFSMRKV